MSEINGIPVGFAGIQVVRHKDEEIVAAVKRAARRFYERFGRVPSMCFVRVADEVEQDRVAGIELEGMDVIPTTTGLLLHHVWAGDSNAPR